MIRNASSTDSAVSRLRSAVDPGLAVRLSAVVTLALPASK